MSGVGDDVNPCSRTAPCKTFAGAISKTAINGEINCLDPDTFVSAGADGSEPLVIGDLTPGTYHMVIVNFAQLGQATDYTLIAYTRPTPPRPSSSGALVPATLLLLLALALIRAITLRRV